MCFHSSAARKNRSKAWAKIKACSWRLTKIDASVVNTSARLPISIACSAFKASITAPGPTGIPAARNARAKPTTLSEIRPDAGAEVGVVIITLGISGRAKREPGIWRLLRELTDFEIPGSRQSGAPRNDEESSLARGF